MPILIGSYVRIKNQTAIGEVISIHLHKVLISFGALYVHLSVESVEIVTPLSCIDTKTKYSNPIPAYRQARQKDPILDLHGLNKTQALLALEQCLDRSLLLGHNRLKIIHGQGKGILRNAIRHYLNDHPLVKKIILESPIHYMAGMTIIEI